VKSISRRKETLSRRPANTRETFDCAQEEIGEIIGGSAPTTPLRVAEEPSYPASQLGGASDRANDSIGPKLSVARPHGVLASRRRNSLTRGCEDTGGDWSDNFLAEFNSIITNEINELTKERTRGQVARSDHDVRTVQIVQYRELLNEFGISDSEGSDRAAGFESPRKRESPRERERSLVNGCCLLNSDYDEPQDRVNPDDRKSGSLPGNLQIISGKRDRFDAEVNSDYDEPNGCPPISDRIDRVASSLPSKLERGRAPGGDTRLSPRHAPKTSVGLSSRANEKLGFQAESLVEKQGSNAKLPPRQRSERKTSLPVNLMSQKRRKATRLQRLRRGSDEQENMDPDYDDVFPVEETGRSKSLDNRVPKSAPVTPTEDKKPPFSRLSKKRHTPVFHESTDDVILVSVSSLPDDQDLLRMRNDRLHRETQGGNDKTKEPLVGKKRALSPLTLRSDITAKRLSESDKDVRRVSPVDLKKFSLVRRRRGNDVAVNCDLAANDHVDGDCGNENCGTHAGKLEHNDARRIMEEQKTGSVSFSYLGKAELCLRSNAIARLRSRLIISIDHLAVAHFPAVPTVENSKRLGLLLPKQPAHGFSHVLRHGDANLARDLEKFQLHLGQRLRLSPR